MDQMKKMFKNTPVLISFMIFLLPSVVLAVIIAICYAPELGNIADRIVYGYEHYDEYGNSIRYSLGERVEILSSKDKFNYYLFKLLSKVVWIMPILISITVVPYIFYKVKIKKPLQLMLESAEKIQNENLDFVIDYESKDEMGKLCVAFEKMRFSLEENNKSTWRLLEERRELNAIFAHDLRTPLTVLHGYSDFLIKYVPEEKLSKEKLIQTVETMNQHILRIENYVQLMNKIQRFEDIEVTYNIVSFRSLSERLQESVQMMKTKKKIDFQVIGADQIIQLDEQLIQQVFDNVLSNAMKHSNNKILVECKIQEKYYQLKISDDGNGFAQESLPFVTQPFYRSEKDYSQQHFGIGLYTVKKLCDKHGGKLLVDNNENGGATIIVTFKIKS